MIIMLLLSAAGDVRPDHIAADMVFVIDEKPHPRFKRDGNDLVLHQRVSLADALCGMDLNIQTLDGRTLHIPLKDGVIQPGQQKVVR